MISFHLKRPQNKNFQNPNNFKWRLINSEKLTVHYYYEQGNDDFYPIEVL